MPGRHCGNATHVAESEFSAFNWIIQLFSSVYMSKDVWSTHSHHKVDKTLLTHVSCSTSCPNWLVGSLQRLLLRPNIDRVLTGSIERAERFVYQQLTSEKLCKSFLE